MKLVLLAIIIMLVPISSALNNSSNISTYRAYNSSDNSTYSQIPNGTGFDGLLRENGYCEGICQVSNFIDLLDDWVEIIWYVGMGLVIYRYKTIGATR